MVDAVVHVWRATASATSVHNIFFADDGWLASHDAVKVQESLECLTGLFQQVGLEMNAMKMKTLIGGNGVAVTRLTTPTYTRKLSGVRELYSAHKC